MMLCCVVVIALAWLGLMWLCMICSGLLCIVLVRCACVSVCV